MKLNLATCWAPDRGATSRDHGNLASQLQRRAVSFAGQCLLCKQYGVAGALRQYQSVDKQGAHGTCLHSCLLINMCQELLLSLVPSRPKTQSLGWPKPRPLQQCLKAAVNVVPQSFLSSSPHSTSFPSGSCCGCWTPTLATRTGNWSRCKKNKVTFAVQAAQGTQHGSWLRWLQQHCHKKRNHGQMICFNSSFFFFVSSQFWKLQFKLHVR